MDLHEIDWNSDSGAFKDWHTKAVEEQHFEDNIFPPAMEDREALELLMHYLLPEGWYSPNPIGPKQVLTEAVEEVLYRHSERYRKELKRNAARRMDARRRDR